MALKTGVWRLVVLSSLTVLVLAAPGLSGPRGFALDATFQDSHDGSIPYGITSDGYGAYIDHGDPNHKTPSVISDGKNFQFNLSGSTRTLCLNFDRVQSWLVLATLAPIHNCFPVSANTLQTETNEGVFDLLPRTTDTFSMVYYWTGMGVDGKSHDYNLAYRRRDLSGLSATADPDGNHWSLESLPGVTGRVSVYLSGKGGGWNVVGDYDLPFHVDLARHSN